MEDVGQLPTDQRLTRMMEVDDSDTNVKLTFSQRMENICTQLLAQMDNASFI